MKKELFVVDDEPKICTALKAFFEEKGFHVTTVTTAQAAREQIAQAAGAVVLLDLKLPDGSGLEVLSHIKERCPNLRVIMISGAGDASSVDEALQRGASDYLTKPFDFDRCFYAAMGIETVDLTTVQVDPAAVAKVPASVSKQYHVLPISFIRDTLGLAMADPFDVQRLEELRVLLRCDIRPLAAIGGELTQAIQRSYGVGAGVSVRSRPRQSTEAPEQTTRPFGEVVDESSGVVRLVSELIQHAYLDRSTDLHLGVGAEGPWIRERIDGILYDVPVAAQFAELYPSVVSRLKVMANLDIAERRLPQDGRMWFDLGAAQLDLRVSIVPTPHGESVAIRLLEPSRMLHLEQLGLDEDQCRETVSLLAKPTGLLLVTGPTGSGKSTSLYAFLSKLNTGRVNIVSIEDPIEHELRGLTQIQVQPKVGLTFAGGLRSMLRHDPDIIMVGEIRDQETASLAVRAALTGHLVLSSLHTNDAASGITRLLDLGVEPFVLCSTVSAILSQRLIRVLCESCRASADVEAAALVPLGFGIAGQTGRTKVWRAKGCRRCRDTGYFGRTGIFELLTVDHHIRSLIIKRTSSTQIRQSAISRGMRTLGQSGWQAMQEGITSLEELSRILPSELR